MNAVEKSLVERIKKTGMVIATKPGATLRNQSKKKITYQITVEFDGDAERPAGTMELITDWICDLRDSLSDSRPEWGPWDFKSKLLRTRRTK